MIPFNHPPGPTMEDVARNLARAAKILGPPLPACEESDVMPLRDGIRSVFAPIIDVLAAMLDWILPSWMDRNPLTVIAAIGVVWFVWMVLMFIIAGAMS